MLTCAAWNGVHVSCHDLVSIPALTLAVFLQIEQRSSTPIQQLRCNVPFVLVAEELQGLMTNSRAAMRAHLAAETAQRRMLLV